MRYAAVSTLSVALPAFSQKHDWEGRFFIDPDTGVRIMQATSAPTVNMNLYFRSRCWTPDGKIFLFWSMTRPERSGIGSFTNDGRRFCFNVQLGAKRYAIAYLDVPGNKVTIIPKYFKVPIHPQIEPSNGHLINFISEKNAQGYSLYVIDENGCDEQALPILGVNGHVTWLGGSGNICSAVSGDSRGLFVAAPGDTEPVLLAQSPPNYWQSGCEICSVQFNTHWCSAGVCRRNTGADEKEFAGSF